MTEPRKVHVVTDSTSDLPQVLRNQYDITIVPLTVTFGSQSFIDGVEITPSEFLDRLTHADALPTTSQPPAPDFARVFTEVLNRDQDVVCITLSSELSGTFNAARLAAQEFDSSRIRIIDSRATTMQLGWIAVDAARAAEKGTDVETVAARATGAINRANCFAVLRTLDYVYKGGRIGRASHLVGSALGIKPVLNIVDGLVTPVERVRTWKKALARATELAATTGNPSDFAVLHSDNLPDARATADKLRQQFPDANIVIDWAGSAIMTYTGPGAIGIMTLSQP